MIHVDENKKSHYRGRLGDFWYDESEWAIMRKYSYNGSFEVLQYRGSETDGSRIVIPEGILNTSYMFEYKSLQTPPVIPAGVQAADYMFQENTSLLYGAALPYGLTSAAFMYRNCRSMVAGSNMPDTLRKASHMYDGCYSMQQPVELSRNLENMNGLYRNCRNLRDYNRTVPKTVKEMENWLYGCRYLESHLNNRMY